MAFGKLRKSIFGRGAVSDLDFSDGAGGFIRLPDERNIPALPLQPAREPLHLARNKTERGRLQQLMQREAKTGDGMYIGDRYLTFKQRISVWMVNEGQRKIFVFVWVLAQALVFALGRRVILPFYCQFTCSELWTERLCQLPSQRQFDSSQSELRNHLSVSLHL